MKLAIMQPYLFPYIGYWQLIGAVDEFVILDDVNYIKRGFINRNSILINGTPYRFVIPVSHASQNRLIMDTKLNFSQDEKIEFLKKIELAYKKAPEYKNVMPMIQDIIQNPDDDLTQYIFYQLKEISEYLKIETEFKLSSKIEKNNDLRGQDRIIEICRKQNADIYINPCGGKKLYDRKKFYDNSIELFFIEMQKNLISYDQRTDTFIRDLSIIDVLMNAPCDLIIQLLNAYSLVTE